MPKYKPTDDGKVVGGKVVVFQTERQQSLALLRKSARAATAKATAAALTAAAKKGVPFCEDCERARKALEARGR
jgi:hypothetical protein